MAVKIRLLRMGRKKRPFYRMVVVDSRTRSRSGSYIESIGYYDPMTAKDSIKVDEAKALLWLGRGALPTDTVKNILSKEGIIEKFHTQKYTKTIADVK